MKKSLLVIILTVVCVCNLSTVTVLAAGEENSITVMANGEVVRCESYGQSATIIDGRTLVPLRAIFEALNASVEWDGATQTVTSKRDGVIITVTIGSKVMIKNGQNIALDVSAQLINSRTMVPVRAVAEAFGATVEWDQLNSTVMISTDGNVKLIKEYAIALKSYLNDVLLRPDTLQIYKLYTGYQSEYKSSPFAVCFNLSAMNGYGGYSRVYYTVHKATTGDFVFKNLDSFSKLLNAKEYPLSILD